MMSNLVVVVEVGLEDPSLIKQVLRCWVYKEQYHP